MIVPEYPFPPGFRWGAATAAYQIEGSPRAGGKGESIWDRFSHTPGCIFTGETGDRACDHYCRYAEDVDLMAELGIRAYRFSVSWPRIFPTGSGKPNREGLDFYRRLVEALLAKGILPAATLYHWDLPQALQDRGGWLNRDTALRFAEYASHLWHSLDLPVDLWITLNEPWVVAFMGHFYGVHPPGETDFAAALQAGHHLLLAHGLAAGAFRQAGRRGEQIGITLDLSAVEPFSAADPLDRDAARRMDGFKNRWFLDPVLKGSYPEDTREHFARLCPLPRVLPGDMEAIGAPLDFLGINNYTRQLVKGAPGDDFVGMPVNPPESEYTEMQWEVYPEGLYSLLTRVRRDYGALPLYVTENGAAFADVLEAGGVVHDGRRIAFLREYIFQAWRAMQEGVPLKGYFVWTLMDNFEWTYGFSRRFGLVYTDFAQDCRRIVKDSGYWYRDLAARNALIR